MPGLYGLRLYENVARFFVTRHDRPPRYVLLITAYLDESEHSVSDKYMAVAGFVGNDDQWNALVPAWREGLGNRKALRMSDLRFRSKPERARKLLARLGPIPYRCGLTPVAGVVRVSDYYDIVAGSKEAKRELSGYIVCLSGIIHALHRLIPSQHSIRIVCEMQPAYQHSAQKMWWALTRIIAHPKHPYFSGLEFIPKGSSLLMQPADFLAFALTKVFEDEESRTAQLCDAILGDRKVSGYFIDRSKARKIMLGAKALYGPMW